MDKSNSGIEFFSFDFGMASDSFSSVWNTEYVESGFSSVSHSGFSSLTESLKAKYCYAMTAEPCSVHLEVKLSKEQEESPVKLKSKHAEK